MSVSRYLDLISILFNYYVTSERYKQNYFCYIISAKSGLFTFHKKLETQREEETDNIYC